MTNKKKKQINNVNSKTITEKIAKDALKMFVHTLNVYP